MSLAEEILERVAAEVATRARPPVLLTVLVGPEGRRWIELKREACERVGMVWRGAFLAADCSQDELEAACRAEADGVFVQHPLPAHLSMPELANDVDDRCTARGALLVLARHGIELASSYSLVGSGHYAAEDIARLLEERGATALPPDQADILVVAGPAEPRSGQAVIDLTGQARPRDDLALYVPPRGCLGPLTVALLLENTLRRAR